MNKKDILFFNKKLKYTFHKSTPTSQFVQRKHVYWLSFEQVMLNLNCFMSAAWVATGKYYAGALLRIVDMKLCWFRNIEQDFPLWETSVHKISRDKYLMSLNKECQRYERGHLEIRNPIECKTTYIYIYIYILRI
jgi:hypothetical protein